jgi:hypothetical protein
MEKVIKNASRIEEGWGEEYNFRLEAFLVLFNITSGIPVSYTGERVGMRPN